MPMQGQPRQVTVNDIIHADPRVVAIKQEYTKVQNEENEDILKLSYAEADKIANMGAFKYLNNYDEVEEARKELLPEFRKLITQIHILIENLKDKRMLKEELTNKFNKLAEEIVEDLKKKFRPHPESSESGLESGESASESGNCACGNPDCGCKH